ncbi:hypothetical protein GCM10023157_08760 [Gluconacetobacter asukensis]|uniref:Transposase n=1 Tax=Gluconacetobacter asukensis TaxID=1017181 RepID=A0A7W4J1R9_9PROT|nr:hypothetical protein [Gluconacetobacter asukensis]MBB2173095.1 hypothetical protein [Gluconacetobacter asukensis]
MGAGHQGNNAAVAANERHAFAKPGWLAGKALERDVRELPQANEILRKASAYFAEAALDPFCLSSNDATHRRNLPAGFAFFGNEDIR